MSKLRWMLALAIALVAVDQLTKRWAESALADGPIVLIDGFLQLRFTENPGASFSSFQDAGPLLAIIAVGVAAWIVMMMRRSVHTLEILSLSLVLGGAVGNLVDRLTRGDGLLDGAVVDFVDFSFFPTFNVADSAITVGALLLVAAVLRHGGETDLEAAADGTPEAAVPGGTEPEAAAGGEDA